MFQIWSVLLKKMDMDLHKPQEMVKDREALRAAVNGVTKKWTRLNSMQKNNMQKRDRLFSILFHRINPETVDGITSKYPTGETERIVFQTMSLEMLHPKQIDQY